MRVVLIHAALAAAALGQCEPGWVEGPQGFGLTPSAAMVTTWTDPTQPGGWRLAVGGVRTVAGVPVPGVALWDGARWAPAGAGLGRDPRCLLGSTRGLLAGGTFSQPDGPRGVAIFQNGTWSQFGPPLAGNVVRLGEHAGRFFAATQGTGWSLFEWDGGPAWTPVECDGAITLGPVTPEGLWASGTFTRIGGTPAHGTAYFDGTSWHAADVGDEQGAGHICLHEGRAYGLGGRWVLRWEGSRWVHVMPSLEDFPQSLASFGGSLYLGGVFQDDPDPAHRQNLYRWDGLAWTTVGDGLPQTGAPFVPRIRLAPTPAGLLVCGEFPSAGGHSANNLALWDGRTWSSAGGMPGAVNALIPFRGSLIAGGSFWSLGEQRASWIAAANGFDFEPLGLGVDGPVHALTVLGDDLIAGGEFTHAGGRPAAGIARWDGRVWSALGAGFNAPVRALTVHEGRLFAGGDFTASGSTTVSHAAAWDGSTWRPLAAGTDGPVYTLRSYDASLFAGGWFRSAGGDAVGNIARWDGTAWSDVDGGTDGPVRALEVWRGSLFAGGDFSRLISGDVYALGIARWTAAEGWSPVGTNLGWMHALHATDDALLMGVRGLVFGGTIPVAVRWDGSTATPLGALAGPAGALVSTIAETEGGLTLGGDFSRIDGLLSVSLARRPAAGPPRFARAPRDTAADAGSTAELTAALVEGVPERRPVSYQWRRDGSPITDGPGGASSGGGNVSGSSGLLDASRPIPLRIAGCTAFDAGRYDLLLRDACGETTSATARLTVRETPCPADFTRDGVVDGSDYDAFILAFERGDPGADFNGDGFLDFFDDEGFITAFELGC